MNKKKAIICTTLFAIIFIATLIGAYFIKFFDGSVNGAYLIAAFVFGEWIDDCITKFYQWISVKR